MSKLCSATQQVYRFLDEQMMLAYKEKRPECWETAERLLLEAELPWVFRARALVILSFYSSEFAVKRAQEAVRIMDEVVRQQCREGETEQARQFPQITYEFACEALRSAERKALERQRAEEASDSLSAMSIQSPVATPRPMTPRSPARRELPASWREPSVSPVRPALDLTPRSRMASRATSPAPEPSPTHPAYPGFLTPDSRQHRIRRPREDAQRRDESPTKKKT